LVATLIALVAATAAAVDRDLGTFKTWRAHTFAESGHTVCSLWSQPQSAKGKYQHRGEVFVFVTHRPAEKRSDRVSFEIGYQLKKGTRLEVRIDGREFELFADGSTAWSDDAAENKTMARLMRAGRRMVVKGVSTRGTKTVDTYSLRGFTAAHDAINKACKVR